MVNSAIRMVTLAEIKCNIHHFIFQRFKIALCVIFLRTIYIKPYEKLCYSFYVEFYIHFFNKCPRFMVPGSKKGFLRYFSSTKIRPQAKIDSFAFKNSNIIIEGLFWKRKD